jgi:Lysyl oxidase
MMNQTAWWLAMGALLAAILLAGIGCSLPQKQGETRRNEPPARTEGQGEASAAELLPDIDPTAPTGLTIAPNESGGFHLSFDATFDNVGAGPLHIDGHRPNTSSRMVADQVITRSDGSTKINPSVGELEFVESEDHRHWHFFRFMRYELIRPADGTVVAPDQKTGFCIGDRYNTDPDVRLRGEPPMPGVFDVPPNNDWCARNDPERLNLTMGLSVGYGDNYLAFLDGQSIDVTNVAEGSYYLVHRVNAEVRESDYSNNAASVLLKLRWPNGFDSPPTIVELASCADTARCLSEQT